MTEKKSSKPSAKAPPLKQAGATQRMSKDELAELLKKAEAEDPDNQPHARRPNDSNDSNDPNDSNDSNDDQRDAVHDARAHDRDRERDAKKPATSKKPAKK